MSCLLCLYALSMVAVVTHTPYVAIAYGEVILTTDAQPTALPDTYVVPVRGNVTFTCTSPGGDLLWSLNVTGSMGYSRVRSNTEGLKSNPALSVSDESTDTTSIITLQNISLESNPSPVECRDLSITDGSKDVAVLMIIVEGSPNCPTVRTTVNTTSLTVSIQTSQMMWLPEWYCAKAVSYNGSKVSIVGNSTLNGSTSFEVTPIQPDTVYNISVIPCNMAGCNESCDVLSVQTESETSITRVPTGTGETPHVVTTPPLIYIIGGVILGFMVLVILVAVATASAGLYIRRKRGKWTLAKGTAEQRRVKPQSTQPEYAETAMNHNGTSNTEYAVVAHSNTSAKGHLAQGPSHQTNATCATGPGNSPLEYATVQDALHVTENIPRSHPSLTNTPRLPLSSPPVPPSSPPGVGISPDCVQDAGYASLPDSRNGSNRITKVRSLRKK